MTIANFVIGTFITARKEILPLFKSLSLFCCDLHCMFI